MFESGFGAKFQGSAHKKSKWENSKANFGVHWEFEAWRGETFLWYDDFYNLVFDRGLDHILNTIFRSTTGGESPIDPWYIGLTANFPLNPVESWEIAQLAPNEFTDYTQSAYPQASWNGAPTSGGTGNRQITNSSSPALFTMGGGTEPYSIGGAFLVSDATKPLTTPNPGIAYCAGDFVSQKTGLNDADELRVTATVIARSS